MKPALCVQAWDTLFWFAVLVGMSGQLNSSGVISHFADIVGGKLTSMNMGWQPVFGLLNGAYFVLHYMFASQTAHVGALYAAFLAMMLSAGDFSYLSSELTLLSTLQLSCKHVIHQNPVHDGSAMHVPHQPMSPLHLLY